MAWVILKKIKMEISETFFFACYKPFHFSKSNFITSGTAITESQNNRIFGVGRDLCGSSSPTTLPKQGHLQQAAQDIVQAGLSPEKETCSSVPSPSEGRSSSSCSDRTSYASVCSRCPLTCHWALLKRVWPHPPDTRP